MQKRRNLLLGSAVAGVTFMLLLLLSFVGGVTKSLTDAALTISSGHVNIGGFFKVRSDRAQAVVQNRQDLLNLTKETLPDLDYIIQRGRGWGRVVSPSSSLNTSLLGVDSDDFPRMTALNLLTPQPDFQLFGAGTGAILFKAQAERLGVDVGETITFITEGNGTETNTTDLTVVGIASDLGFLSNFSIIVSKETVRSLYRYKEDTTGALHIYLRNISQAPDAANLLRQALSRAGYDLLEPDPQPFFLKFRRIVSEDWKGQKLDVTVWEDEVSFLFWIITSLNALSVFLIGILGLIIAVGIANTTWMSVRERTREMGTMRAIGMQTPQVLLLFLTEAALLGFFSSAAGSIAGVGAIWLLDSAAMPIPNQDLKAFLMSDTFRFAVGINQVSGTVFIISLLTAFAAAFPAWRASRMNPVAALGHAS
jgi:ABC-type lipoprotein release transport system permease subunit